VRQCCTKGDLSSQSVFTCRLPRCPPRSLCHVMRGCLMAARWSDQPTRHQASPAGAARGDGIVDGMMNVHAGQCRHCCPYCRPAALRAGQHPVLTKNAVCGILPQSADPSAGLPSCTSSRMSTAGGGEGCAGCTVLAPLPTLWRLQIIAGVYTLQAGCPASRSATCGDPYRGCFLQGPTTRSRPACWTAKVLQPAGVNNLNLPTCSPLG
jgi:hypothetical protein